MLLHLSLSLSLPLSLSVFLSFDCHFAVRRPVGFSSFLRAFSSSAGERNTVEQTVLGVVSGALAAAQYLRRTGQDCQDGSNMFKSGSD